MKYTNKLITETSPYLLQHAHNPVNWYAWGSEALLLAKQLDKPILVSIGYAACHWCHVMEKESFENETVAAYMNEYFINIKIDREERPDLDHIYMDAVQAITGSGGWPLNVFLTPKAKPFFGGTYFPPKPIHGRLSWLQVLQNIATAYQQKKDEVEEQAESLTKYIQQSNTFLLNHPSDNFSLSKETTETITNNILKQADNIWGGFGNAPKFPQTITIQFLLRQYHFSKNEKSLQQALLSLDKMIFGGLYDKVGGGFARYSTDAKWFAPHFEKMLYDNALFIAVLSEAYQITKNTLYKETIDETIVFFNREMKNDEGGFYAALDADSEGAEGKFYTWSFEEVKKILQEDAEMYINFYGLKEDGNWEHSNILWQQQTYQQYAAANKLDEVHIKQLIKKCNKKLLLQRNKRTRPLTDDKILLGWNALLVTAFTKAYCATLNNEYKTAAIELMNFLQEKFIVADKIYHTYKNAEAKIDAFADDVAYFIQANILLQEITADEKYLLQAKHWLNFATENFATENLFFHFTQKNQQDIIAQKTELYDAATPSANSTMAFNLIYLSIVFNNHHWKQRANKMIEYVYEVIIKHPTSFANWAIAVQLLVEDLKEIVIVGKNLNKDLAIVNQCFIPNKILQSATAKKKLFPLLSFKPIYKKNTFYLCKNYSCKTPFETIEEFLANL